MSTSTIAMSSTRRRLANLVKQARRTPWRRRPQRAVDAPTRKRAGERKHVPAASSPGADNLRSKERFPFWTYRVDFRRNLPLGILAGGGSEGDPAGRERDGHQTKKPVCYR